MNNINLNVPALNVRNMSYKGYPITIIMISNDTYVYELAGGVRIIETQCEHGSHILYVDTKQGTSIVISRESLIYKELFYRISNADLLEDGEYAYHANTNSSTQQDVYRGSSHTSH